MGKQEKPFVISCGILRDEIQKLIDSGQLDIDIRYLGAGLHHDYDRLEMALESALQHARRNHRRTGIVVYGDLCMGFDHEIRNIVNKHGFVKVDALNCLDCLLGGKGRVLKVDPNHKVFFLTPGWIKFWNRFERSKDDLRHRYRMLDGLIALDSLGNLDESKDEMKEISHQTGLPVMERKQVGLDGLKRVIVEAVESLRRR